MPIFLIPILILIGIFAFSAGGDILKNIDIPLPSLQLFSQKSVEKVTPKAATPRPSTIRQAPLKTSLPFVLNTVITKGPTEDTKISDTNVVTFEFEGSVNPTDTAGRITFETKIEGVDPDWKATSSRQRKITLPGGPAEYTFLVRAKLKNEVDTTPATRAFRVNVSPSFGKITIGSFRRATSSSPFMFTLSSHLKSGETLSISNWTLKSNTGSFSIGFGAERISPVGTAFQKRIVLNRGDKVLVSGAASPFGAGGNFRPNICFGWLAQYYSFPLSVPSSCPDRPSLQDVSFLTPACQDFILKEVNFSRCEVPSYSQNAAVAANAPCITYINDNLNYGACVTKHSGDSNFLKNEWQVFANRSFGHPTHDTIQLLDENGLFVDRKVY
ncbi:hypothetical protein IH982_00360 [Patescibacteria group bacterium]|nr:hypothetical protein [Patescibacteria group bacterium]